MAARVFFALWPAGGVRDALAALASAAQAECGGRATAPDKIHATLFFVGEIERARVGRLEAIGASTRGRAFALDVNALKYWNHNRIVWAGTNRCPPELSALAASLTRALAAEGVHGGDRPYVPHVTLARNARRAPKQTRMVPLQWLVADFVLVESVRVGRGSRYDVMARWPLDASQQ